MKGILAEEGCIKAADIKGGSHLPIEGYAEIINRAIGQINKKLVENDGIDTDYFSLVAARLNIEFKREIKKGDEYRVYVRLDQLENRIVQIQGKILVDKKIRAKWDAKLIIWNKEKNHREVISNTLKQNIDNLKKNEIVTF